VKIRPVKRKQEGIVRNNVSGGPFSKYLTLAAY
jgi:hypothetical protein